MFVHFNLVKTLLALEEAVKQRTREKAETEAKTPELQKHVRLCNIFNVCVCLRVLSVRLLLSNIYFDLLKFRYLLNCFLSSPSLTLQKQRWNQRPNMKNIFFIFFVFGGNLLYFNFNSNPRILKRFPRCALTW